MASSPTLSISDAERRVYHNRSVSDALHHHRISDTMMMSTHPLVPRTSALTARYCSRVADTAVVQADERRVVRGTKKGRTEARPYDLMVFSAMYCVENGQSRVAACCDLPWVRNKSVAYPVAACCDLPGDSFSFCKVSDLALTMSKIYAI